jgi:hypothetical protein
MRAFSIEAFGHVAVRAENLESGRECILEKPFIERHSVPLYPDFPPMFRPVVVYVVDLKEFDVRFAAASTAAISVVIHDLRLESP